VTFTLAEVLTIVGVIAGVVFVVIFARLAFQLNNTAAEMEKTARNFNELVPPARRLLEQSQGAFEEIRELTRRTTKIADDVQAVTGEASTLSLQVLRALEGQIGDRARAAVAGARAGFTALRRGDGSETKT
jgi:uncharacterized protein YoxC